jgi:transcriptional regulator with XRE-family HTH domain
MWIETVSIIRMEQIQMTDAEKAYAAAIGAAFKEVKERTTLTFDDLAAMSKVPRATVSRIIYGTIDAKIADMRRLAEVLDVPLEEILDAADAMVSTK